MEGVFATIAAWLLINQTLDLNKIIGCIAIFFGVIIVQLLPIIKKRMTNKLDVVGIGNAMVDAMIPSNKEEVEKNNLNRDSMNLIDEDLKNSLHKIIL